MNIIHAEAELERMIDLLETETEALGPLMVVASQAESDYRLAQAKARATAEGKNAEQRDANAMLTEVALYEGTHSQPLHLYERARTETAMLRDYKEAEIRSIRENQASLRTLNSNARIVV